MTEQTTDKTPKLQSAEFSVDQSIGESAYLWRADDGSTMVKLVLSEAKAKSLTSVNPGPAVSEQTNEKTLGQLAMRQWDLVWNGPDPTPVEGGYDPCGLSKRDAAWRSAADLISSHASAPLLARIAELEAKVEHLQKIVDRKTGRICVLCDGPIVDHYCSKCDTCTR